MGLRLKGLGLRVWVGYASRDPKRFILRFRVQFSKLSSGSTATIRFGPDRVHVIMQKFSCIANITCIPV